MRHLYALVTGDDIGRAVQLGRTDYDYPPYNRAVRYSLDQSAALVEGLFNDDEVEWLEQHGTVLGDAAAARAYIEAYRAEWEAESAE